MYDWASGDNYSGEWIDNKKNGKGQLIYSNGDTFIGEFLNEKRHGKG